MTHGVGMTVDGFLDEPEKPPLVPQIIKPLFVDGNTFDCAFLVVNKVKRAMFHRIALASLFPSHGCSGRFKAKETYVNTGFAAAAYVWPCIYHPLIGSLTSIFSQEVLARRRHIELASISA